VPLPVPEGPRLIYDVLGTLDRLPLGDGFVSVPVTELRGALLRRFRDDKLEVGVHFQIARGYSGQTTEVLNGIEQVTGVYIPSYHFSRSNHP
jgi:hypothetical protein